MIYSLAAITHVYLIWLVLCTKNVFKWEMSKFFKKCKKKKSKKSMLYSPSKSCAGEYE